MKKIFTLCAAIVCTTAMFAASYGIMINGSEFHAGELNPTPGDPAFTEYMVLGVSVANGSTLQLWDEENNAGWAVDLDNASVATIVRDGDHYNCTADGCYDFYIKLQYNNDQLYIGSCSGENPGGGQGGGENPGGGQGGGAVEGNPRYYYKGYIDNADVEPSEATIFDHGVAEIEFSTNAMLFVLYQVDGFEGVQYMTPEWIDGQTHTTLYVNGNGGYNKWNCPLGATKLYLYDNGDGTLEISCEPLQGKKLADPQPEGGNEGGNEQAIDNTTVSEKAHKIFVDGQLRIVRGEKMYDATGREL